MPKSIYGYQLGGNINEKDPPKGVKIVPDNKTLIVMPFNEDHDSEVDPVRLKSLKDIFEYYQPEKEVETKDIEDNAEEFTLKFSSLKDFSKEGIVNQIPMLTQLEEQEKLYARFTDILEYNQKLRSVITNEDKKKEFIDLLELLIQEIE